MLAVLCSASRPPLGVALLGLLITTFSLTLRLLPYTVFCSMIVLSIWVPSRPAEPEPVYYPLLGHSNHVYPVYTNNVSPFADKIRPFELNAGLRILIFLLAVPVTSILENTLFRPARDIFVRTVEFWYDLRYVQAAQLTGSWPATRVPILNALRSFQFMADFIDGAVEVEKGPSLPHGRKERETDILTPNSEPEIVECGETPLQKRLALQKASSSHRTVRNNHRQKLGHKHTPSPNPVIHSKGEDSCKTHHARITFISPPRVSSSSPWVNCGSEASPPISKSKNLSRIVGIIFHYPPPRKPALRPRLDLRTRAHSARSSNVDFERAFSSASWAPISLLRTSSAGVSATPCSDLTNVEQVQYPVFPENVQRPHATRPSQPPILMHPQFFVSNLQAKQPIQTHYTQSPVSFYHEQHIPVYGPQFTFSPQPNAPELPLACPEPASYLSAFQQYPSEQMDIVDHPQLISEPLQKPRAQEQSTFSALGSSPHVHASSYYPQNQPDFTQFSDAPQAPFSNHPPGFSLPHCSSPHFPSISQREVRPLPTCEPGLMAPISQSHVIQPVQNYNTTETFAFDILPDTATPHIDFSCHATLTQPPCSDSPESTPTREALLDDSPMWHASSEYAPAQPLDPKPLEPSFPSSHLPEVMPQPSSPADSVRAIAGGDDKVAPESEESDSDTSDSDYSESSSEEDDSDSDPDSSDDSDEEEVTITVCPSE